MLKRCSNCAHCHLDLKSLWMNAYIHKCYASPIFEQRHHILHPFWSGWRCKNWKKPDRGSPCNINHTMLYNCGERKNNDG